MNWTNHNWSTVQCQIDFCSVGFCSVINCLDGTSSVFNWPLSQLCFCSIVICSIIHLFNLLIALLSIVEWFIVQLARFSVDFLFNCVLFNWLLFSWIFVESFCSIHLVQWVVGEVTWKVRIYTMKSCKGSGCVNADSEGRYVMICIIILFKLTQPILVLFFRVCAARVEY